MEQVNFKRPHRAIVRCQAKMHLLEISFNQSEETEPIDDALLKDLTTTLFQSNPHSIMDEPLSSHPNVTSEQQLVDELVQTYQHISQRQQEPIVQRLNALL
ncbi:hypothetical protein [Egbenema bharatensis]|uniref:hypothetical protein n=1 Tax=Egbenema bharatensis TaxID=3463334 RepID=UPI003A86A231